ncbi:MAG: hypothetical protein WBA41_33855 [Rivularia sp. (in: cyanobacteria)]
MATTEPMAIAAVLKGSINKYTSKRLYGCILTPRYFTGWIGVYPDRKICKRSDEMTQKRLFLIAVLAVSPIIIAAFTWRCNSVNLHLKAWSVEYSFEKGAYDLTQ